MEEGEGTQHQLDLFHEPLEEKHTVEMRSTDSAASSGGDEEETKEDLKRKVDELKSTVSYMSHQLNMIMGVLHVPACCCGGCSSTRPVLNGHHDQQQQLMQHNNESLSLGAEYGQRAAGGKFPLIDRRTVSDYALQHGGAAAVRRFGVPAPVASYYQRKDVKGVGGNSPGPSSSDGGGERNGGGGGEESCSSQSMGTPASSTMDAMLRMSSSISGIPASLTGTPGFLRGRGRGRPKLIGDELDADLVEYMVQLQKSDLSLARISATQALEVARAYILEKAPGLLEEQGGHVKLKLTWAMKLVSRIGERQKEIELGLPAGTLQNMGKSQQIAEIMAMSKFGGFPGAGGGTAGDLNGISTSLEAALHQHQAAAAIVSAPEITNVRELDLSHLSAAVVAPAGSASSASSQHLLSHGGMDLAGHAHMPAGTGDLPLIGANGEILFPHDEQE